MRRAPDYYQILQVPSGACREEIVRAYRRLVKLYHPDVNADAGAERLMKAINEAYDILQDDLRREAYNRARSGTPTGGPAAGRGAAPPDPEAAAAVLANYLRCLRSGACGEAYLLLCRQDRQLVTEQSFVRWRQAVQQLFLIRDFSIRQGEWLPGFAPQGSPLQAALQLHIDLCEKTRATGRVERYSLSKVMLWEEGGWRVYLGHRDLDETVRLLEAQLARQEQEEMRLHWAAHCREVCRALDLLSTAGLLKAAQLEQYRCRRYGQSMTLACFSLTPAGGRCTEEAMADLLETAARLMRGALRKTDLAAYLGEGRFAVLLIELKPRYTARILERLLAMLREGLQAHCGVAVSTRYAFVRYGGQPVQELLDRLSRQV